MSLTQVTPNYNHLSHQILELGVNKVRFEIPMAKIEMVIGGLAMTSGDADRPLQMCYISEKRRKVEDNYKIDLVAFDIDYGHDSFYFMDLGSLMSDNPTMKMFVAESDYESPEGFHPISEAVAGTEYILGFWHEGYWRTLPWEWGSPFDKLTITPEVVTHFREMTERDREIYDDLKKILADSE